MLFLAGCENQNPNSDWWQKLIDEDVESRYALLTDKVIKTLGFVRMKFSDVKPFTKCYVHTNMLNNKKVKDLYISFWKVKEFAMVPENNQTLVESIFVKGDTEVFVRQYELDLEFSAEKYYSDFLRTCAKAKDLSAYVVPKTKKVLIVNADSGRTAMSVCSKYDPFNWEVGVALAWARYCGHDTSDSEY